MLIRTLALGAALSFTLASAMAQDAKMDLTEHAQLRAECYGQALGMDAKETARLAAVLANGEQEVAELRAQVAALQQQIEEQMAPHDASAEKLLSKDQRTKLEALRKNGWKPCSEPCAAPGTAAACTGKEGGKGAACCAGAAGTGAKAAPVKPAPPAPNATME